MSNFLFLILGIVLGAIITLLGWLPMVFIRKRCKMNNEEAIEIIKFLIDRFMNIKDLKHDAEAMKTVLNYIEELEEKIKVCTDTGAKLIDTKFIKNNFIPKQKVRDKIEELEEEDLEIYDTDSEDLIIAKYEQRAVLDFAQQLLNDKEEK